MIRFRSVIPHRNQKFQEASPQSSISVFASKSTLRRQVSLGQPSKQSRSMFGRPSEENIYGTSEKMEMPHLMRTTVIHAGLNLSTGHRLEICQGDLTKENTQAIVNTANEHLMHLSGLSHAIAKAGGTHLQEESENWVRQHGPVPVGEVAVTSSGSMGPHPIEYVIHAVSPAWHGGNNNDEELMHTTVKNCLGKAAELGVDSLAIPCFSTGICRFPKDTCAKIFFHGIAEFCREQGQEPRQAPKLIRVTNLDDISTRIFVRLLHDTHEFDDIRAGEIDQDSQPYV